MLEILTENNRTHFSPGETINIGIRWEQPAGLESLELRVVCNTVGKGDQDLNTVQTWEATPLSQRGEDWLEIVLPTAPYSFSGKLISLVWALELISFPGEESFRREIVIAPEATEILLTPAVPTL